jgi:hypothetical protein
MRSLRCEILCDRYTPAQKTSRSPVSWTTWRILLTCIRPNARQGKRSISRSWLLRTVWAPSLAGPCVPVPSAGTRCLSASCRAWLANDKASSDASSKYLNSLFKFSTRSGGVAASGVANSAFSASACSQTADRARHNFLWETAVNETF